MKDLKIDKELIKRAVMGTMPGYSIFDDDTVKKCGSYNGSYGTWDWNISELDKLSIEELYELYNKCLNS